MSGCSSNVDREHPYKQTCPAERRERYSFRRDHSAGSSNTRVTDTTIFTGHPADTTARRRNNDRIRRAIVVREARNFRSNAGDRRPSVRAAAAAIPYGKNTKRTLRTNSDTFTPIPKRLVGNERKPGRAITSVGYCAIYAIRTTDYVTGDDRRDIYIILHDCCLSAIIVPRSPR